jgi:hypothetical protein
MRLVLFALVCALPVLAADWNPVNPADLALKQSRTDPNADAEALFREVHVLNEQHGAAYPKNIVSEYVRLKIFTERGQKFGDVQIPYFRDSNVYNVQGRTIHPDGSIVELGKDSIFDKVIEKRGYKTKVISFALPAVQPGSIIEFRYTKDEGERSFRYRQLEVQSLYPVDQVTFFVKPLSTARGYPVMRLMPFFCEPERGQPTNDGYDVLIVKNVPAFHEEPYSPPEFSAKQWILIYYEENDKSGKEKYWTALGKQRYHEYSEQIKINREIKELAAQITSGANTDDAKLDKLLTYCRTEIKDIYGDKITTAELDKVKANKTTIDTIRRKEGDSEDIKLAFLALAQGAGFDARRVDLSDRATFLFGPGMQSGFFLNSFDIAVNVGGTWKFYDVTNNAVPGGQLRWQEQGVYGLIADSKDPELVKTPMLPAQQSSRSRVAEFTLSADGVLEGDVRVILAGNEASVWREENRNTNDTQREDALREQLKSRFSDFDLSKVKYTANPDPSKPVGFTYHLVVRNYAQRTGKRLFVQPNYFAAGFGSRFAEATRHNSIYFEYPWSETDAINLAVPAGFELDHADAPAGINIPPTCTYKVQIAFDKAHNEIQYRRYLTFGDKDLLIFDAKVYPNLKKVFDAMHEADNHMLTFKATATTEGGTN